MSVWIATISVLNASNAAETLRFSDGAYTDASWNYYEARMHQPAIIKVSPEDGGTFNIFSTAAFGEIDLENIDGGLDYLADYALDGGLCVLSLVDAGVVTNYLTAIISTMHERDSHIFLTINNLNEVLAKPHPFEKYTGANVLPDGLEGVLGDIKGNIKPKVFGTVTNATPVAVNTSREIYQFSSRQTCTVSMIYDMGLALALGTTFTYANLASFQTTVPTAGTFNRCAGYVRLGTTAVGTITGDAFDGSYLAPGNVFEAVISEVTRISVSLNSASKAALNISGEVGIYVNSEESTASILNKIVVSIGAFWYFKASVIFAGYTTLATTATLEFNDYEIEMAERTATGIGSNGLPISTVKVKYNKIETVQAPTELAGAVTAARQAALANEFRTVTSTDAAVLTRHPMSETVEIESYLLTEGTAQAVSDRLLLNFKSRCDIVSIAANVITIPDLTLGIGVKIITPKLGYSAGKILTLIGYEIDAKLKKITMELIG